MNWLRRIYARMRGIWHAETIQQEIAEELQFHLDLRTEENLKRGMSPEEARRAAERRFGNASVIKDMGWEVRGNWLASFGQDLRYGARMLRKNPSFSLIAIITLALGIGANTAIFSVVNAVLLRPLPYPEADRLVYVGQQYRGEVAGSGGPKFLFWREQSQSFEALACYSQYGGAGGNLAGGQEAEYVTGLRVSEDFFRVLRVYPVLGRAFTHEEDTPGGARVGIVSDGLWRRSFGADKDLIGKTVLLNGQPLTVVGIMPPQFRFGANVDLFVPMRAQRGSDVDPNAEVVGRLKPGVTLQQAQAELKLIAEKYRAAFPREMQANESIGAKPYQDLFTEDVAKYLWIFLGAVSFLLLIACANVANLQLSRATARQHEIAMRLALGASGGRIMRQLLTEGLLLALVGGAAGLLVAFWGTELLTTLLPQGFLPRVAELNIDWHVLAFAFAASIMTGLLFGAAPAWQARKVDVNTALKESASKGTTTRGRLRGMLVVAEVALSLVLLVSAGLLIRTFTNLLGVTPGFDPHNVLTFQINLNGERYKTTDRASAFYHDALERISHLPGVEAAAVTNKLPLDWQFNLPIFFPDKPDEAQSVQFRVITPDYFRVMKIDVTEGRAFNDADTPAGQPVAIVNEAFVRRFYAGKNPLAQQFSVGRTIDEPERQIVGIVSDIKQQGLDRPAPAMVYVPMPQVSDKLLAIVRSFTPASFAVRTTVEPTSLTPTIKREIAAMDATLPLSHIATMEEVAAHSITSQRFNMLLLCLFAALGLLLAAVGIYGVTSYSVLQRTQEIGIRMALGAQSKDMLRMIIRQGMALVLLGVVIGLIGAFALTRVMQSLLYGISATDPLTFALLTLLLTLVALVACYLPARRATKVDPLIALRYE
jgi:putative ABC transport system permease protein